MDDQSIGAMMYDQAKIKFRAGLHGFQFGMHQWRRKNFPEATAEDQFLGVVEEVGELAHAILKHKQGIRGMDDATFESLERDSVGDIFIYLAGYCSLRGIRMEQAIMQAWDEVEKRDWITNPSDGGING